MYVNNLVMKEIRDIPRILELIKDYTGNIDKLTSNISSSELNEIIYTGCGSSFFAAVRSSHVSMSSYIKVHSLPASELLWIIPHKNAGKTSRRVFLMFSRSGETAEIKALLNTIRSYDKGIVIGFTCNPSSFLANNSDYFIAIKECMEDSVYMTKSFVALSLLGTIFSIKLLEKLGYEKIGNDLEGELESLIETSKTLVLDLTNPSRYANELLGKSPVILLGTEDLYPIALEAALKFIEVSYTTAMALHALEFRHGYTGLLESPNLSMILLSNTKQKSYEYVERLYNELKSTGKGIIHISNSKNADYVIDTKGRSRLETLAYIIPLYYIALFKALSQGYNPDEPKHIVKTVTHF